MKETKNEQPCEPKIFTSELTEIDTNEIYIRLSNYFKSDEFINKLKAGKVFGEIQNEGFNLNILLFFLLLLILRWNYGNWNC